MEHELSSGKFEIGSTIFNAICGSLTGLIILFLICAFVWLQKVSYSNYTNIKKWKLKNQEKQARLQKQRKSTDSSAFYSVVRRLSMKGR